MHRAEAPSIFAERSLHSRRSGNYVQRGVLDAVPIVAPLPDSILERCIVAPGLLAQIVVSNTVP